MSPHGTERLGKQTNKHGLVNDIKNGDEKKGKKRKVKGRRKGKEGKGERRERGGEGEERKRERKKEKRERRRERKRK